AHTQAEKLAQRKYFFWYDPAYREDIKRSLLKMHRSDLLKQLFPRQASYPYSSARPKNRPPKK
ncbi:MAG: hypothetical protein K2K92_09475, partial [Duncaniella sp.]|nr:hypothetical protein [Duncaniella sp.]